MRTPSYVEDSTRKIKRRKIILPLSSSSVFTNESVVIPSELGNKSNNQSTHIPMTPKKALG